MGLASLSRNNLLTPFCITVLLVASWFLISTTNWSNMSRLNLSMMFNTASPIEFRLAPINTTIDTNLANAYFNATRELTKDFKLGALQELNVDILAQKHTPAYNMSPVYVKASQRKDFKTKYFPCKVDHSSRDLIFRTLQRWLKYADHRRLYWWLTYGSLLSSIRNADMNPWDSDADIAMPQKFKELIKNDQDTQAKFGIKIVTRPSVHCAFNGGDRRSCHGKKVNTMVDVCAFCGPYGRIFLSDGTKRISSTYIDLYILELYPDATAFDEGLQEYTNDIVLRPIRWYFPLKLCNFMGFSLPCPNDHSHILSEVYTPQYIKPKWVCDINTHSWIET